MRVFSQNTICVTYLIHVLLFCVGHIHGQNQQGNQGDRQRRLRIPSVSDILNDAINLENAALQFDRATANGNQQEPATSDSSTGTGSQQGGMGPSPIDNTHAPGGVHIAENLHVQPATSHGQGPDHRQQNQGLNVPNIITDPAGVPPTMPFATQGNIGPSLVDLQNIDSFLLGLSVHQTPPESLSGHRDFVDLGRTQQDLSSLIQNSAVHQTVNTVDPFPGTAIGPAVPGNPVDVPFDPNTAGITQGSSIFGPDLSDPLDMHNDLLSPSEQANTFPGSPIDPAFPANPVDIPLGSGQPAIPVDVPMSAASPANPINIPVDPNPISASIGPGFAPDTSVFGSEPIDPFGTVSGPAIDNHAGSANDHSHQGIHIDEIGQHGNNQNERALHIPDGMTMEDVRQSGILETLAQGGSSGTAGGVSSPQGFPQQPTPTQNAQITNVFPGSSTGPGNTISEIPMQIPEGMSMEEARRSGILDALAHDTSIRTAGTSSSQGRPVQPVQIQSVQNTNVLPGSPPSGSVGTVPEIPMQIPEGMSMEEARRSGILDALAHDQSLRSGGASSSVGSPAQTVPVQPVFPGSPSGPVSTMSGIPMQIPEGMSMEEARRSGILDALAHDQSVRPGSAPSSQVSPPLTSPTHPVRSGSPTRHGHAVSGIPFDGRPIGRTAGSVLPGFDPNFAPNVPFLPRPVVPVGLPQGAMNVPVPGRMGRRGRRWRNANRRRNRGQRFRPASGRGGAGFQGPGFPGQHHHGGPAHGRRQGPGARGGLLGELMRTAVQIGTGGGVSNTQPSPWQQAFRSNPVQITRSGSIHSQTEHRQPGAALRGGGVNTFRPNQGDQLVNQIGNSLLNAIGSMIG